MTTLTFRGIDFDVYYIDPSLKLAEGDGSSKDKAANELPDELVNNTCYVIRRTDEGDVYVKQQKDKALTNIMFLGMPKATDPEWIQNLVTDLGADDWKNDAAAYANVRFWHRSDNTDTTNWNRAAINSAALENVFCINCYLYRKDSASAYTSVNQYAMTSPFFANNGNNTYQTSMEFHNCKFGVQGIDLDKDEFLNAHSNIRELDVSPQFYSVWGKMFVCAPTLETLIISNCVINHTGYNNNYTNTHDTVSYSMFSSGAAFVAGGVHNLQIEDTTINTCGVYSNSGAQNYDEVFTLQNVLNGSISNIKVNQILGGSSMEGLCYITSAKLGRIYIDKIDIYFKRFKNYTAEGKITNFLVGPRIKLYDGFGHSITNIVIHRDGSTAKVAQACALHTEGRPYSGATPFSWNIDNIKVELDDTPENCVYPTLQTNPYCLMLDFNIGMSDSGSVSTASLDEFRRYNLTDYPLIQNIEVDAPYCKILVNKVIANFKEMHCGLELKSGNTIEIDKLTHDKLPTEGITVTGAGNYLRLKDYVIDPAIADGTLQMNCNFKRNAIYIDKTNAKLATSTLDDNVTDPYLYSQICCLNMEKDGRLFARNGQTFAQSWNVKRTGSVSEASLKLSCNLANNALPLVIGAEPYKGFGVTPKSTGVQNLVAYFAIKDFHLEAEKDGKQKFKLMISVPYKDEAGKTYYKTYYSMPHQWQEDESVWSDVDYLARKIVVPIDVKTTDEPVEVKVSYNWYNTAGFVYLDPDIRLEAL